MNNFDDLKLATEAMSGGKNTVLLDDVGMPSIMVVIPKMTSDALITGATQTTHPAFIVDGVEKDKVYVSKYLNIVQNNRAYSLPMQDPKIAIDFNTALTMCRNKGNGWGLTPASLWAAIALWCKKNGTMPHGNNYYGVDYTYKYENGIATTVAGDGKINKTAAGSGPSTWNHDFTNAGICDLNGNVWKWQAGVRLKNGEIQIIPNADCIKYDCDMGEESADWKKIDKNGKLYDEDANINDTLKYDYINKIITISTNVTTVSGTETEGTGDSCQFGEINLADTITTAPQILKELALFPSDSNGYDGSRFYINNSPTGPRLFRAGGQYTSGYSGSILTGSFTSTYTHKGDIGFYSAYYEL